MVRLSRCFGLSALILVALFGSPRAFCLAVPGDFTNDGLVNMDDLPGFRQAWITAHNGGAVDSRADMNGDKVINYKDAELFLDQMLQPGTMYVQWDPSVTIVDQAHMNLLKSADVSTGTYTFDAAGVQAAGLNMSPGRILVIYNTDLCKVVTSQQEGGDLVLTTTPATLADAIVNGTIAWDHPIEFSPDKVLVPTATGAWVHPAAIQNPFTITLTIGNFTYTITIGLEGTEATCTISAKKSLSNLASITGTVTGTIQDEVSHDRIDIQNHQITDYQHSMNHMTGNLTVGVVAVASGDDNVVLTLPVTIMEVPFVVGFIPVVVDITAQFVIKASVPVDGSAQVKANFDYDSDVGFTYDGTQVSASGGLSSESITKEITQTGASGPIAASFGVGFPRVSLSIAHQSVVLWLQPAYDVGGDYVIYPTPCQRAQVELLGAAGYNLSVLGIINIPGGSNSITIFDKHEMLLDTCNGITSVSPTAVSPTAPGPKSLAKPEYLLDFDNTVKELAGRLLG